MAAMEQLKVVHSDKWLDASQGALAKWLRGLSLTQQLLFMALIPLPLVSAAILVPYLMDNGSLQEEAAHERGLAIVRLLAPAAEFGVVIRSVTHLNPLVETVLAQDDVASVVIYDHVGEVIVQRGHPDIALAGQLVSATRARFMLAQNGRMSFAAPVNSQPAVLDDIANANMLVGDTPGAPNTVGWVYVELDTHSFGLHAYGVMWVSVLFALAALSTSAYIVLRLAHAVGDPVARLAYQAQHDSLTGLANRRASDQCSLCLMDLDHFKEVNDLGGHAAGDARQPGTPVLIYAWARRADGRAE
jgi:hypothetical protein